MKTKGSVSIMMAGGPRTAAGQDSGRVTAADIARAVDTGQIVPWFQPIVDLPSGRLIGVEALARWERDPHPPRTPDRFLPIAERSELILAVDLSIIEQSLAALAGWQRINADFRLSINLSARHFASTDILEQVFRLTAQSGVPAATVDLEITETVPPANARRAQSVMTGFRELGFRVWLDDFGTGWNSLEQLLNPAVDGLKIDRSFAAAMTTPIGSIVTQSIAELARHLDLLLTIEGVETAEQAAAAVELGCQYGQGYLWSRAVPAESIDPLRTWSR